MEISTPAVLLSYFKYGDSAAIVRFFTFESGFQSFIWKGVYSSKSKNKHFLTPLNEMIIYYRYKETQNLSLLKKAEPLEPKALPQISIEINTLLLFLSEVLNSLLQNEPENKPLYHFIQSRIEGFKTQEKTQFWVQEFLLEFTRYIGAKPYNNYEESFLFDLEAGNFQITGGIQSLSIENSALWARFLQDASQHFSSWERLQILDILIRYFQVQVPYFKAPKSLEIIKEVFSA